jgi:LPS-assembly lipoprotein
MRKVLALPALLLLAGCGFHPMYGSALEPRLAAVYVEPIGERDGYELRNSLIDLLHSDGTKAGKYYILKVSLNENSQGIALRNDATITRYNQTLTAHYVLTDARGTVLTEGDQTNLSAYNVANSPFATLAAAQDSSKRAAQDIAERIHLDLGAYFRRAK